MRLTGPQSQSVQMLRALAITGVVVIHCCPLGLPQVFVRPLVNFCVALFLFLSGYLTNADQGDLRAFYGRRLRRVLPPYAVWTAVYTFTGGDILAGGGRSIVLSFVSNLFTGRAAAQMYFIPVYVQLVLLTPLLGRLLRSRWRSISWVISPISVIFAVYVPLLSGSALTGVSAVLWGECCLGWLGFYCLGLALGNGFLHIRLRTRSLVTINILSLLAQTAEGYVFLLLGNANCGTQLKLSSLVASCLFCLISWRFVQGRDTLGDGWIARAMVSLGDCSFGVYLSHIAFLMVLRKVMPFGGAIGAIALALLTLISSWAFVLVGGRLCGSRLSRFVGLR